MKMNRNMELFRKAEAYMQENIRNKLYVHEIAEHLRISNSCLEKNFSKVTKMGVMCYFLDMKLAHSANMLKNGMSVGKIAKELNFSSTAHFSMAFKKKYRVSPMRYKYSTIEEAGK